MALSRTALDVKLERDEIKMLIAALVEAMYRSSEKEDFADAAGYKRRVEQLMEALDTPMPE